MRILQMILIFICMEHFLLTILLLKCNILFLSAWMEYNLLQITRSIFSVDHSFHVASASANCWIKKRLGIFNRLGRSIVNENIFAIVAWSKFIPTVSINVSSIEIELFTIIGWSSYHPFVLLKCRYLPTCVRLERPLLMWSTLEIHPI